MSAGRVLILDDEYDVGATVALMAERSGLETRHTTDPIEFLALHRSWSPTHLMVDLLMPDIDGIHVLAALAHERCRASIIILSGVDERIIEAARLFATENGLKIAGSLHKPFGRRALEPLLRVGLADNEPGIDEEADVRLVPVEDLAEAVRTPGELQVVYQPKVRSGDGSLAGFEALVRWTHPTLGAVLPSALVRLAEEHDLIDELTDRVLEQSLSWFAGSDHGSGNGSRTTLSVNMSARTLRDHNLVSRLTEHCERSGVSPTSLILELTETTRPDDPVMSLGLLTSLRVRGFQLSLDDFGTGFSSMSELARLPFSEIKVDHSFVSTALRVHESRSVVKSVIELGHQLGLRVTAEGVEDGPTLDLIHVLKADLVQGFHIARPLEAERAASWQPVPR